MSKANHYLLTPEKYEALLTTLRTDKRVDVVRRAQPLLQLHKGERIAAVEESVFDSLKGNQYPAE